MCVMQEFEARKEAITSDIERRRAKLQLVLAKLSKLKVACLSLSS